MLSHCKSYLSICTALYRPTRMSTQSIENKNAFTICTGIKQTKFLVQILLCTHIKNVGKPTNLKGLTSWMALRVRFAVRKVFSIGHTGPIII